MEDSGWFQPPDKISSYDAYKKLETNISPPNYRKQGVLVGQKCVLWIHVIYDKLVIYLTVDRQTTNGAYNGDNKRSRTAYTRHQILELEKEFHFNR